LSEQNTHTKICPFLSISGSRYGGITCDAECRLYHPTLGCLLAPADGYRETLTRELGRIADALEAIAREAK